MFLNFRAFFFQQNVHFCSKLWHFFSAINYSINSSVIVYKIHIFVAFFLPRTRCFDNWKVPFSLFSLLPLVGEHIPSKLCSLSKHPWKNRVKQIKTTQENLSQMCILCPVAKDPDPSNGVKKQKVFFLIYNTICKTPEWNWFGLACLNFLEFPLLPICTFCAQDLLKYYAVQ